MIFKLKFLIPFYFLFTSCSFIMPTSKVKQILNDTESISKGRDYLESKYGKPDIRYSSYDKTKCIVYTGDDNEYCRLCFDKKDSIYRKGSGRNFRIPDIKEDLITLEKTSNELNSMPFYYAAFQQNEIMEGEVRIWIFPSFEKELLIKFFTSSDSISVLRLNKKSFVTDLDKNILQLNITAETQDLISHLNSINLTELQSIKKRASYFDGTEFVIESMLDNKKNTIVMMNIPWYNSTYDKINSVIEAAFNSYR
jgi:hypothetical protein